MPNIRIKVYPGGKPATSKFQLLDPNQLDNGVPIREKGYRHLEPGEIVEVDEKLAKSLLVARGDYLELTLEEPTRPLYLGDIGTARMTSQTFNANSEEKVADQKAAKQRVAEMVKPKRRSRVVEESDTE